MSGNSPRPGLRERKRTQTRARIEAAAVELVLSNGLDAATVDAISDRADVSSRTFFNYFDSKDAAVLGMRPREADEGVIAAQLAVVDELDPVVALIRLVMATMGVAESVEAGLQRQRLDIIRRHPEIVGGQFAQLHARQDRLAAHAALILARHEARKSDPASAVALTAADLDLTAQARGAIVLAMCASAVRSAVQSWANSTDVTGRDVMGADDVDLIEQRALALVLTTLEKLA